MKFTRTWAIGLVIGLAIGTLSVYYLKPVVTAHNYPAKCAGLEGPARKLVLIVSPYIYYTSRVGSFFNKHPDFVYFFEPERVLWNSFAPSFLHFFFNVYECTFVLDKKFTHQMFWPGACNQSKFCSFIDDEPLTTITDSSLALYAPELQYYCLNHNVAMKTRETIDLSTLSLLGMDNLYLIVELRDPRAVVNANLQLSQLDAEDIRDYSKQLCANYRTLISTSKKLHPRLVILSGEESDSQLYRRLAAFTNVDLPGKLAHKSGRTLSPYDLPWEQQLTPEIQEVVNEECKFVIEHYSNTMLNQW